MHARLKGIKRLFLDTAPIVYYVEANARYLPLVQVVFEWIDSGTLLAVTSPVTLAECLVMPYRKNQRELQEAFVDLITSGDNTFFQEIDQKVASQAAELRAKYNITLTDAFQIASALSANCDSFLTNDITLKRVSELDIILLEELDNA